MWRFLWKDGAHLTNNATIVFYGNMVNFLNNSTFKQQVAIGNSRPTQTDNSKIRKNCTSTKNEIGKEISNDECSDTFHFQI